VESTVWDAAFDVAAGDVPARLTWTRRAASGTKSSRRSTTWLLPAGTELPNGQRRRQWSAAADLSIQKRCRNTRRPNWPASARRWVDRLLHDALQRGQAGQFYLSA